MAQAALWKQKLKGQVLGEFGFVGERLLGQAGGSRVKLLDCADVSQCQTFDVIGGLRFSLQDGQEFRV